MAPMIDGFHGRVGVLSPNVLMNVDDSNQMGHDPDCPWRFESLAKKASVLFDKIYVTHDLEVTCELLESDGNVDANPYSATMRYLVEQGFILTPSDIGFTAIADFIDSNLVGLAGELHAQLLQIGNPGIEGDEDYLIGQPDVGDFAAHDGCHPRAGRALSISCQREMYESILLRRNVALLKQAGLEDVAIVGRLYRERSRTSLVVPVWSILINEMPQLDTRASWHDVLQFRQEARTQHLTRQVRLWARKVVAEPWTEAELEDEIRESLFEYENYLRMSRMGGNTGVLELLIIGAANLVEDVMKLRFGKLGKVVSVLRERRVKLLEAEAQAPGRELALLSELRKRSL